VTRATSLRRLDHPPGDPPTVAGVLTGSVATGRFATAVLVLSTGAFFAIFESAAADAVVLLLWSMAYVIAGAALLDGVLRERLTVRVPASLVAFLVLATSSVLWSSAPEVTLRRSFGLIGTVLIGLLIAQRLRPVEILEVIRRAMLIVALASLLLWVIGDARVFDPTHETLRGVVSTKNTLGRVMGLGLLASAGIAFIDRARGRRAVLSTLPMVIALALTGSTGGVLIAVLVLGLMTAAVLWSASTGRIFLVGAGALVLAAVAFAFPSTTAEDVVALVGRDLTFTGRTEIWALSLDAAAQRSVLGYGFGAFWHEDGPIEAARIVALLYWSVPNAHNGLLDVVLDVGVVGGIVALTVLGGLLVRGVLDARTGRRQSAVLRLSIGLLVLVSNLAESSFMQENAFLTLAFVAALAAREPDDPDRVVEQVGLDR
jgi:exopolysaccharide production protein ExoQ